MYKQLEYIILRCDDVLQVTASLSMLPTSHYDKEKADRAVIFIEIFATPKVNGLKDDEDWEDEANWYKVNPSLGYTVDIERFFLIIDIIYY